MIKYTVRCADGHDFEGWFKDSKTFEAQSKSGRIECPICGNAEVDRAPMAPRIAKARELPAGVKESHAREVAEKVIEAMRSIRKDVEANCDYVGDEFAEEARKIHYGEAEERGIYGEATTEEAKELDEEGIPVYRLPTPPRRNG